MESRLILVVLWAVLTIWNRNLAYLQAHAQPSQNARSVSVAKRSLTESEFDTCMNVPFHNINLS